MLRALNTASTGMRVQQVQLDIVANNLANASTTGFKRSRADFQDLLYVTLERPGAQTAAGTQAPTGLQIGSGARLISTSRNLQQGALEQTERALDVAIEGTGFLQVQLPDGSNAYTRAGALRLDADGQLVTPEGYRLVPQVTIAQDALDIKIGRDGTVTVSPSSAPDTQVQVGTIQLAVFTNPAGLEAIGQNLLRETPASGAVQLVTPGTNGAGSIVQGALERSNVDVVTELVNLISTQRAYEVNSRAIRSADEMLATSNNLTR